MVKSLFATTSDLQAGTGGGIVSYNIALALKEVTDLKLILCSGSTDIAPCKDINPVAYALPPVPFLYDYIASQYAIKVDIAHFRGDPFGLTTRILKFLNPDVKIVVDVPAHNLEESIREFQNLGMRYPFVHMVDDRLWNFYALHVRNADVVVAPSQLSANYIATSKKFARVFLHKPVIKIIPHGVDMPKDVHYPEKFTVLHVGVNGVDKGQIYLIRAWKLLQNKIDGELILAGEGTEGWRSMNIKNLEALGRVKRVDKLYRDASIYVQPSVTEGWGLPVGEAMAHGKPVIVTEGTGAKDMVRNNYNGFIVPIRDPSAIARMIQYFYDNQSEIKRMGANARLTAKNYQWSNIRRKYQKLYGELIG